MENTEENTNQSPEEQKLKQVSEELKGSDADVDQSSVDGDQSTAEEKEEQIKGSDADYDDGKV